MSFRKVLKNGIMALTLCLLFIAAVLWQPSSYAWLSTSIRSSTFSVKSSDVSTISAELWINAYHEYEHWTENGWYKDEFTGVTTTTPSLKRFNSIGTVTTVDTTTTFVPSSSISLHFGSINNLAQEQENLPVYLKFKVSLKPQTNNTVILTYKNDSASVGGNYLNIYTIQFDKPKVNGQYIGSLVTDSALLSELNQIDEYPFLRFYYFKSFTDYTITEGQTDLSSVDSEYKGENNETVKENADFASLFENTKLAKEYVLNSPTVQSIDFPNPSNDYKDGFIYVRINVRSDTLSEALTNSDLKNYVPAYLVFAMALDLEIRSTAATASGS